MKMAVQLTKFEGGRYFVKTRLSPQDVQREAGRADGIIELHADGAWVELERRDVVPLWVTPEMKLAAGTVQF